MTSKGFIAFLALILMAVFIFYADQTEAGIVENGLVSYYSFNNIEDDIVNDDWGINDGTIIGAEVADGKYGDALMFNGQDNYVDCGNDESLDITEAISIEAWVYMKSPGTYPTVVSKSGSNWGYIFEFLTATGQINLYLDGANPSWANVANTAVSLEEWTHIAATYDGKKVRYYFNGKPDGDYAAGSPILSNADNVHIGGRKVGEPHNFEGIIDEVRIYNRALDEAEVKINMNSDSTAVSPSASLTATWGSVKLSR